MKKSSAIFFLVIFLLQFFKIKLLYGSWFDYVTLSVILFFAFSKKMRIKKSSSPMLVFCGFILLSCLYTHFVYHQSVTQVLFHCYPYFSILFYFAMVNFDLNFKQTETLIRRICIVFCVCYLLQWIVFPFVIFSDAESDMVGANVFRMRLPGSLCCYLLFFYGINKFLLSRKAKCLTFALLGFMPILIQGFRSLVALSLIGCFLIIPFTLRNGWKTFLYALLAAVAVGAIAISPLGQSKMNEMVERQKTDTFSNSDYIRYRSFEYLVDYYNDPLMRIVGGGLPIDAKTSYVQDDRYAKERYIFWVDWGLVGLSFIIGIPAVIILIYLYLQCAIRCTSPNLQYVRFSLLVVVLASLVTSMEAFRLGNILILSILLYYVERFYYEETNANQNLLIREM